MDKNTDIEMQHTDSIDGPEARREVNFAADGTPPINISDTIDSTGSDSTEGEDVIDGPDVFKLARKLLKSFKGRRKQPQQTPGPILPLSYHNLRRLSTNPVMIRIL